MARIPRIYSESGFYHVMIRGINREKIFGDCHSKNAFLNILGRNFISGEDYGKDPRKGCLYAFCILDNHAHLLIQESPVGISNLMQRVSCAYANYYNRRHGRSGPVFESRFTSKAIEDQMYFAQVVKYIHNNPVKAKISKDFYDYEWSSANYYNGKHLPFLDTVFLRSIISDMDFQDWMRLPDQKKTQHMVCKWPERVSDFTIISTIKSIYPKYRYGMKVDVLPEFIILPLLDRLIQINGIAKTQIGRILGIRTYEINKVLARLRL